MNNDNSNQYYEDEIDLRQIFKSLKERSRFIFGFNGVVTLITFVATKPYSSILKKHQ